MCSWRLQNESSSWPIELLSPRRWHSILYYKNNGWGRRLQPTYTKNIRKASKESAKSKFLTSEGRTDIGAKGYRNCLENLAWSRGSLFPPHREIIYFHILFLIPVILTNKGEVKKEVLIDLFIIKIFNLQRLKFKLIFILKIDIY